VTPIEPLDKEKIDAVVGLAKWFSGIAAAIWLASKTIFKTGMKAGEEKRKYEELNEDVDALEKQNGGYLTKTEHESLSRYCRLEIEHMIDARIHNALTDLRQEMGTMNGNICKILGAMNIEPVEPGQRRRSDAQEDRA